MNAAEHWEAAERLVDMVTDSETGLIVPLDADGQPGGFTTQMLAAAQVHALLAIGAESVSYALLASGRSSPRDRASQGHDRWANLTPDERAAEMAMIDEHMAEEYRRREAGEAP